MNNIEADILDALQAATTAAVAQSLLPSLPIAYFGRTFTPPNDNRYLEIVHIPNNIQGEFWGNEKTYRGLYRLILNWGLDDAGGDQPLRLIGSISSYFVKGSIFQSGEVSVKIYDQPDLTGVIAAAPKTLYPATVRYMFFKR